MKYRTIIDMKNSNALITKAMLASYIEDKKADYLDIISPFILKSLPERVGSLIDIEAVTKQTNLEYGLDIKQKIIEKILIRLSKNKQEALIRKENKRSSSLRNTESIKNYYVNKHIDNSEFDERKNQMNNLVNDVVTRLKDFINTNYNILPISYNEAQKFFLNFLNDYNLELYSSIDNLRKIQGVGKNERNNIKVAKFILNEYTHNTSCYNKIREIQEGYFASVAIYFFCKSSDNNNPQKIIAQTNLILDTRILIDVLGLNRESEANSMKELISLIEDNGGKLCTFDYYVEELIGIINKYLKDPDSRLLLDLDFFRRHKCNDTEILIWRDTIVQKLERMNIEIINDIDYSQQINEQSWHIDLLDLKRNMLSYIDYKNGEADIAFDNDYKTLQRISFYKVNNVKNNSRKAIFVTSNYGIICAAKQTFTDSIFKNDIDIVLSDIDLASTLWLSNYNSNCNLSELILLENAYAAICPSKEILADVLRIINNNINSPIEEIKNEAILLRSKENLLDDISNLIANGKPTIDDAFVSQLTDNMKKQVRTEIREQEKEHITQVIEKEVDKKYKEKFESINIKEKELLKKEAEMIEQQNCTNKIHEKSKNLEIQYYEQIAENQSINIIRKNLSEDISRMIRIETQRCEKRAKRISTFFKWISLSLISISFVYGLYYFILFLFETYIKRLPNTINLLVTLGGTILTYIPLYLFIKKSITKITNQIYDNILRKLLQKSEILNK